MSVLKAKSFIRSVPDNEIMCHGSLRFISFERLIQIVEEDYKVQQGKPIGYSVNPDGIEIIYKETNEEIISENEDSTES